MENIKDYGLMIQTHGSKGATAMKVKAAMANFRHPDWPHGIEVNPDKFNKFVMKEIEAYESRRASGLPGDPDYDRIVAQVKAQVEAAKEHTDKNRREREASAARQLKRKRAGDGTRDAGARALREESLTEVRSSRERA